jgi:hypothetical protein
MNAPQRTITEQYDEVERAYAEALYAIHNSQRPLDARLDLVERLMDGHGNATSAAAQLAAIKAVMEEL